jgi:hypothetical protein
MKYIKTFPLILLIAPLVFPALLHVATYYPYKWYFKVDKMITDMLDEEKKDDNG